MLVVWFPGMYEEGIGCRPRASFFSNSSLTYFLIAFFVYFQKLMTVCKKELQVEGQPPEDSFRMKTQFYSFFRNKTVPFWVQIVPRSSWYMICSVNNVIIQYWYRRVHVPLQLQWTVTSTSRRCDENAFEGIHSMRSVQTITGSIFQWYTRFYDYMQYTEWSKSNV